MAEDNKAKPQQEPKKNLVRPMDLPIYDTPKKCSSSEAAATVVAKEPSPVLEAVKMVRLTVQDIASQFRESKKSIDHIIETGSAHTEGTFAMMRQEENLPYRAAYIGGVGLFGYLVAAIRRRRLFGKLLYTTIGAGLATASVYPEDAKDISKDLYAEGERLSKIAINFVQGVQPSDVEAAKKSIDPKEHDKLLDKEDKAFLDKKE